MIKAEELRIGNYVVDIEDGNVYQIPTGTSINRSDLMSPITLTEEWLLKLGFEVSKGFLYLEIDESNTIRFLHKNTHKVIDLHCAGEDDFGATMITKMCLNHIKHVHQLQNLYFALTGEELTLQND